MPRPKDAPEFTLSRQYRSNPIADAQVHRSSSLLHKTALTMRHAPQAAPPGEPFRSIVFEVVARFDSSTLPAPSTPAVGGAAPGGTGAAPRPPSVVMSAVSEIDPSWPAMMNASWAKRVDYNAVARLMERASTTILIPKSASMAMFEDSRRSLQRKCPFATFKLMDNARAPAAAAAAAASGAAPGAAPIAAPRRLLVTAPKSSLAATVAALTGALEAVSQGSHTIGNLPPAVLSRFAVKKAQQAIVLHIGAAVVQAKHVFVTKQHGSVGLKIVRGVFVHPAVAAIKEYLRTQCGWVDPATQTVAPDPLGKKRQKMKGRLAMLLAPQTYPQLSSPTSKGDVMLSFATHVTHATPYFVYGGFVRDYVCCGWVHKEMDIDVAVDVPLYSIDQAERDVRRWVAAHSFSVRKMPRSHTVSEGVRARAHARERERGGEREMPLPTVPSTNARPIHRTFPPACRGSAFLRSPQVRTRSTLSSLTGSTSPRARRPAQHL